MNANDHKLLMIPGPIEFSSEVLQANAFPSTSHIDSKFIKVFSETLKGLRTLFKTETGQPLVLSGSGSLGWDVIASNLVEPKQKVLVLITGLFGVRFVDCLKVYGAEVDTLVAKVGDQIDFQLLEEKLKQNNYKLVTVTHVDTSTGVKSDIEKVAKLVKSVNKDTLVAVDGVCSVAGENIEFDGWNLDVVMTASQKALGTPPGLSILMVSQFALKVFEERVHPSTNFYCSLHNWLPIMKAYENLQPSYFATPSVQLILALHTSLQQLLAKPTVDHIFNKHAEQSSWFKQEILKLGLKLVTVSPQVYANTMTAIYYPDNVEAGPFLKAIDESGIVLAGGLHPEIKTKYFRVGHMGHSVLSEECNHLKQTLDIITKVVTQLKP